MATFDLRGIKVAKYTYASSAISYGTAETIGDAMNCTVTQKKAEGRLYAEGALAEYMTRLTGATVSIGVKYIPDSAQKLMYGATERTRSTDKSLAIGKDSDPDYVGCGFYAPCKIDGATKYKAVFLPKVLFGAPDMSYQTQGDSITFSTPTTTGEALPADTNGDVFETIVCDTADAAVAWVASCFTTQPT